METRNEKSRSEMTVPNFNHGYCDNCHGPIEGVSASFNNHADLKRLNVVVDLNACEDCIPEVIAFHHLIRNVSEMTAEIVHRHNQDIYNKVYNRVNFN